MESFFLDVSITDFTSADIARRLATLFTENTQPDLIREHDTPEQFQLAGGQYFATIVPTVNDGNTGFRIGLTARTAPVEVLKAAKTLLIHRLGRTR